MNILGSKAELLPRDSEISYRAGEETFDLTPEEEISILNKLADEDLIEIIYNSGSDYI